jgi:hypothetical protein
VKITHDEKHRYEEYDVDDNPNTKQRRRQDMVFLGISSGDCIPGNILACGGVSRSDQRVETTCDEKGSHDRGLGIGWEEVSITNHGFDVRDQEGEEGKEEGEP